MCQISQLKSFDLGYPPSSMIMCVHNLRFESRVPPTLLKLKKLDSAEYNSRQLQ